MDVTFTNVLEGARQYFQGLPPTATSSSAGGPTYSNNQTNENLPPQNHLQRNNDATTEQQELPPSSTAYWPPPQQDTINNKSALEQRAPPAQHDPIRSTQSNNNNNYQGTNYHLQEQQFQFPRPHSHEAPSNNVVAQQQQHPYPQHVLLNPSSSSSSSYQQQPQQQQTRSSMSRQDQIITSSPSYHQMQNSVPPQTYHNYHQQQQQQQRSYYPGHSETKSPISNNNNSTSYNKVVASSQNQLNSQGNNAYYKHLYTSTASTQQQQMQYNPTTKSQQHQIDKQDQQSYHHRTTHNLPPIASLSLINYHSNRNSGRDGVVRKSSSSSMNQISPTKTSSASMVMPQQQRPSYSTDDYSQQYVVGQQQQQNRLPISQYNTAATTTTTLNYNHVIMTASNSSSNSSYPAAGNSQQQYYQASKRIVQQQPTTTAPIVPNKQKRESPLDLSVKTVRTPADSTLDDLDQSKYYNNNSSTRTNTQISSHNYPTYDVYANSFQRNANQQLPKASAPKVEFHPNFNVSTMNHHHHNYRRNVSSSSSVVTTTPVDNKSLHHRYPTVTVPTVNSYIQQQQMPNNNRRNENLPRIDFPSNNNKTSALYSVPTHDLLKKRPADTAPSAIIPNKMSKVDAWRQSIDQQIEQRFSTYKQQQNNQNKATTTTTIASTTVLMNGNNNSYPMEKMCNNNNNNTYRRPGQYQQPQQQNYNYQNNSHNQTYVPSAGAHQFPGFAGYPQQQNPYLQQQQQQRQQQNSQVVNKGNLQGADKRVLSLLRNSLEIKGAKEAQKKLEQQEQLILNHHHRYDGKPSTNRPDVQHPSTVDVQAPLQPKPNFINRHNVSPFTPTNFPIDGGSHHHHPLYKLQIPKAVDSVNFECDTGRYLGVEQRPHVDDGGTNQASGDLDGLAAFLAARIRTKAELKQVGPGQNACNNNLQGIIEHQLKTPMKLDVGYLGGSSGGSVSPPKLSKEQRHSFAPRRRLFSRTEDDLLLEHGSGKIPLRGDNLRSSSETSVFDFPDSDSEGEMPVLERQTLEDMRRDRKSSTNNKQLPINNNNGEDVDDMFTQTCDSFMEQLRSSGSGKKRGRRKKMVEADVLAKLEETVMTKEKIIDSTVIKKEVVDDEDDDSAIKVNKPVVNDDDDSDVPLINCKNKISPNLNRSKFSSSLDDIRRLDNTNVVKEVVIKSPKREAIDVLFLKEIPKILPRPAKKPPFGDGSHFVPGWEEEVYKYKKSLRMPPSLIQVTRPPQYHRLSTSLPDLDPCPNSPTPSSIVDAKYSTIKREIIDSDNSDDDDEDSNRSFNLFRNNYDSEGSSSIKSLPNTKESTISDKLLEKYGRKKRKYNKRRDLKILPTTNKVELLPTPEIKGKEPNSDSFKKDVFLGNSVDGESTPANNNRTRLKQRVTIKEVFGEDRPASAPPVTCVNHIKEELVVNNRDLIKVDDDEEANLTDTKQVLKNKLLNRCRKENTNLLKSLVVKKIKSEMLDDLEDDMMIQSGKKRSKFRNIRRKFSSGFDYIRKKKKCVKKDQENDNVKINKKLRGQTSVKTNPGSVQDIQKEIKAWVLNKGIGETILHRAARLGYTDITAYCLEKMECSPSPKDNAGYTPLHEASTKGHLGIAKMLLLYGANVSESARGGIRPLHEAVENGYVEVVRLLLSYGADPMLATYSGMTPLALATDDATIKLLQSHINDIQQQEKPSSPWHFQGPASCFDLKETGYDMLADEPDADPPLEEEESIDFEVSDNLLPNLYTLRGESVQDRWILLQDLSSLLKVKSRDALLRQICPQSASSTSQVNYKSVLRELKMSDFLEQAHCCQFLNIGEKVNIRASKIALVKYTDKVKEILNVEKVTISVR